VQVLDRKVDGPRSRRRVGRPSDAHREDVAHTLVDYGFGQGPRVSATDDADERLLSATQPGPDCRVLPRRKRDHGRVS
jgi:hypothetical protein